MPPGRTPKVLTLGPAGQVWYPDQDPHTPGPRLSKHALRHLFGGWEMPTATGSGCHACGTTAPPGPTSLTVLTSNPHTDSRPLSHDGMCPAPEGSDDSSPRIFRAYPCVPQRPTRPETPTPRRARPPGPLGARCGRRPVPPRAEHPESGGPCAGRARCTWSPRHR